MYCRKCKTQLLPGMVRCSQCRRALSKSEINLLNKEDPFDNKNSSENSEWTTNGQASYSWSSGGRNSFGFSGNSGSSFNDNYSSDYISKKKGPLPIIVGVVLTLLILLAVGGFGIGYVIKNIGNAQTTVSVSTSLPTVSVVSVPSVTQIPSISAKEDEYDTEVFTSTTATDEDSEDEIYGSDDAAGGDGYIDDLDAFREFAVAELSDGKTSIRFDVTRDNYELFYAESANVISEVIDENPEFFWLTGGWSFHSSYDNTSATITYTLDTYGDISNIDSKIAAFNKKIDEIVAMADDEADDYEKALFFHDYLINNCEYRDAGYQDEHNAYGCIIDGYCVCEGYSKAFMILCTRVGIECKIAAGGNHAWNYIKLGNDYTFVDVTFDDPVDISTGKGCEGAPFYDYFCISTDELLLDHSFYEDCNPPPCIRLQR